jgi:hypothetical protein
MSEYVEGRGGLEKVLESGGLKRRRGTTAGTMTRKKRPRDGGWMEILLSSAR